MTSIPLTPDKIKVVRVKLLGNDSRVTALYPICNCLEPQGTKGGLCSRCGDAIATDEELADAIRKLERHRQ